MGFAVPAALGAKAGRPDKRVIAIDGDGCFQMTCQELATTTTEKHPVHHGDHQQRAPRAWCASGRSSSTRSATREVYLSYDVAGLREARRGLRRVGLRAEHPDEVDAVIEKALSITDRSVVIDFRVDSDEMCFPMVPAGASATTTSSSGPRACGPTNDPAEAPIA